MLFFSLVSCFLFVKGQISPLINVKVYQLGNSIFCIFPAAIAKR